MRNQQAFSYRYHRVFRAGLGSPVHTLTVDVNFVHVGQLLYTGFGVRTVLMGAH